jgi:hypothetical protein
MAEITKPRTKQGLLAHHAAPRRNAPMTIRYRLTNETGLRLTCHWLGSVSLTL